MPGTDDGYYEKKPDKHEFDFLGEQYKYHLLEGYLQKISNNGTDKRSTHVDQERLEKMVNESFAYVKKFLEANAGFQDMDPFSHANKSPRYLATLNNLIRYYSDELDQKLLLYSQELEQTAGPFGEALSLLKEIIEKNNISLEDPEKAVLQALAQAKKQGKKIKLQYEHVKKLACNLKKNELRRKQNETT